MTNDESTNARKWKNITSATSLVALVALGWGFTEQQRANQLEASLATARSSISEASAKLSAANDQMRSLAKKDLPVTVSFRRALLTSGLVAVFKNNSAEQLEVAAVFSSDATGQEKRANLVLAANGAQEIGGNEGWAFVPGQHIRLSNASYRPLDYTIQALP